MASLNYGKIKLGDLDRKVVLLEYSTGKDKSGAPLTTFSELATVWAMINYRSSKEEEILNKETGVTMVDFYIRYRRDIDTKNKIQYDNRTYDILGVEEVKRKQLLKIKTQQVEIESAAISAQSALTDDQDIKIITDQGGTITFE